MTFSKKKFYSDFFIEVIAYLFLSLIIFCVITLFFILPASAATNTYNFDSQNDGDTPQGDYLSVSGTSVKISNTFSNSIPNSVRFISTTGALFYIATSSSLTIISGNFIIPDCNTSALTIAMNSTASSTNQGLLWLQNYNATTCQIKIRGQNETISQMTTHGFITENVWHSFSINLNADTVDFYIDETLLTTKTLYTNIIDIANIENGNFGGTYSYVDDLFVTDFYDNTTGLDNYDFELSETEPDFGTVTNQICFIGVECRLYFTFNQLAIGYPMYLFNYEDSNFPGNEIASTTVVRTPLWQNYVIVPDQATSTELKYNFLLDAGEYGWIVKTGIKISWWSEQQWEEYLDSIGPQIEEFCAEETVCANVATSSDFLYGVQCGFQKGACWMLVPNSGSKTFFLETVTKFENSFPFNFYFTIVNQAKSDLQKPETASASLDFPMYSTSTKEVTWQPLISSSTVTDVWNDSSYDLTVQIFTWAWWILIIAAITFLVYKQMV